MLSHKLLAMALGILGISPQTGAEEVSQPLVRWLSSYEVEGLSSFKLSCPREQSRGPASVNSSIQVRYTLGEKTEKELKIKMLAGNAESVSLLSRNKGHNELREDITWKTFKPAKGQFFADAKGRKGEYLILTRSQKDSQTQHLEKLIPQLIACCKSHRCRNQSP